MASHRDTRWATPSLPPRDWVSVDAWRHSQPPSTLRWRSTAARPALRLLLDAELELEEAAAVCEEALATLYGTEDDGDG